MIPGGSDTRTDLAGMTLDEAETFISRWGKERYRARQIFRWIYGKHAADFSSMSDLSAGFREALARDCRISAPPVVRERVSADGTEKYLFRLEDGETIESVLIPDEDRRTLCISSQVGCALRCAFCATGAMGFRRDMTPAEIVNQVRFAAARLAGRGEEISNVVFMGMGEPLENPHAVGRAIDILLCQHAFGLAGKRVTVSTAGIVPPLRDLAARFPVSFAVSINAPRDDLRSKLMPVNRRYPLAELVSAIRAIPLASGRRVTAEYVLLAGINDGPGDARELARVLRGARVKVNLIPYNEHAAADFRSPAPADMDRFRDILLTAGIQAIVRQRRGGDIAAACGQLRGEA